ncbi:hypothetical protein [Alteribacter natronophilus]|uniref:hypothetical protein n=1 Tax=Alteribacter natronophilus TaxID=2583810 RepID=UPI00110DB0A8|nr:hypothetical protein [Alteribacter natronophilus]TMW71420.1 hypothetical protein FGB90_10230 [Alteribacter natronophilus]
MISTKWLVVMLAGAVVLMMYLQWESAEEQLWNDLNKRGIFNVGFIEHTEEGTAIVFFEDQFKNEHRAAVYKRNFRSWEFIGNYTLTYELEDLNEYREGEEYPYYMSGMSHPDFGELLVVTVLDPAVERVVFEQDGEKVGEPDLLPEGRQGDEGKARFVYTENKENFLEEIGSWDVSTYDRDGQLIERSTYGD